MPESLTGEETIAIILGGRVFDGRDVFKGIVTSTDISSMGSSTYVTFGTDTGYNNSLCSDRRYMREGGFISCCDSAHCKIYPPEGELEPSCSICKSECKGDKTCAFFTSILEGIK